MLSGISKIILCLAAIAFVATSAVFVSAESQSADEHIEAARAALAKGKTDKAERELKSALQRDPLRAESHLLLASLLALRGEHDQAIVGFQRAATIDPSAPEALYNLGTLLLSRLEPIRAAELLENAVEIRPDHVPSYINLAKAYFISGLPELALATYEEALRLEPSNALAQENLQLLAQRALENPPPGETPPAGESPPPGGTPPPGGLTPGPSIQHDGLRELVRDLPHVTVEERGGEIVFAGWTRGLKEREMLNRILVRRPEVLDLTSDDTGDPDRLIEVDVILFVVIGLETKKVGFNFLRLIDFSFKYFAGDNDRDGTGLGVPGVSDAVSALSRSGWALTASVDYDVNIANATDEQVAVLARPHLSTLSGTPASFLVGGEIVFQVSGINSGDIKPYPFGTTLTVTPTLLRTPNEDGNPRVHIAVEAGRTSILELLTELATESVVFDKVTISSQAILDLGQTLILSGLNQRESRSGTSGVPVLKSVPLVKYFFSAKSTVGLNTSVIILLTPRDPAFVDENNRRSLGDFVDQRTAFVRASAEGDEALILFRERYPDWNQVPPNRYFSHIYLMNHSQLYRAVSGEDLATDALDFEILGEMPKKK